MVLMNSLPLPTNNRCLQCSAIIREPEWVEMSGARVDYVWRCAACGYEFETMAIYSSQRPLAA